MTQKIREKYKIKPTKEQMKFIRSCWKELQRVEDLFFETVALLESQMELETGIKGIEFFRVDGEYVGVGNIDRTIALLNPPTIRREDDFKKNNKFYIRFKPNPHFIIFNNLFGL